MPNAENIHALIAEVKAHADEFRMAHWNTRLPCGTAVCLGGRIEIMLAARGMLYSKAIIREWLGIDESQASQLFFMPDSDTSMLGFDALNLDVRLAAAEIVLTHLADTDVVDWDLAIAQALAQAQAQKEEKEEKNTATA